MIYFVYLSLAIVSEVFATSCLNASAQFTKLLPSLGCVIGYIISFIFLGHAMKGINMGTAYAVWSAVGTVLILLVGAFFFKQHLNVASIIGIALIVVGVVILNLFGNAHS